jgi:multidrug efflux system membrane fusion protein
MMRSNTRFAIGIVIGAISLAACRGTEKYDKPIKPVRVQEVQYFYPGGDPGDGERYSANIVPSMQIELAFKYGGYVADINQVRDAGGRLRYVQEGDRVARGTILARLRSDDFAAKVKQAEAQLAEARSTLETNRAQLSEAEAALRQAERDLDRATKLMESRSLTKPEYEGARTKHELAQARVETVQAQSKVIQAKITAAEALVGEAKLAADDAVLRAPVDCFLLKRMVEPGALIVPGRPVFVITDRSSVKATFGIPDLKLKNVSLGTRVKMTTEALPGVEFGGSISRISPAADPKSRVFDAQITIFNPPAGLRLGMIASLTLPTAKSSTPVTVVPINAIVRLKQAEENYAVNVVTDQAGKQIVKQRPVKLGEAFGNMIAVTAGVSQGERVVVSGSAMMVEGEQVRVIP